MGRQLKRSASAAAVDRDDDTNSAKRSKLHFGNSKPVNMTIEVRGQRFEPTAAFDTFWRLAAERNAIDQKRRSGVSPPWTADPVLASYRFCNAFRVLDRVSQFLITEVIEKGSQKPAEVTFRVLLFSTYTSINTYKTLQREIQPFTWERYSRSNYEKVLRRLYNSGVSIYTGAYQKPAPELGFPENFMNHLAFLEVLMQELPDQLKKAKYMADVFQWLRTFKSMGDFTAYQLILNLSYSNVLNFSEYDFVVVGTGSRRGLQRCFGNNIPRSLEVDLVRYMQLYQEDHFTRLGIVFNGLGEHRRPMMLCDIEHTLCELDKYVRMCENNGRIRPFEPSGKLDKMRLPKAWSHKSRHILRIKCPLEAEAQVVEKFVVESIGAYRKVGGTREFLVFWEGYSNDEATWEPEESLMEDAPSLVKAYLRGLNVS
ncbi:hypothetical protein F5I97DRAFT_900768 [Phlebopus sp. FC_14]|nr:hypothetical protein F5I97DRAFT_900768 [Phlebopus sp. FC_14]